MSEIKGILDVIGDDMRDIWIFLCTIDRGTEVSVEEIEKFQLVEKLKNLIYRLFSEGSIGRELPFINIHCKIHAQFRYDKKQRYQPNDLIDIGHAAWALPYCQYYFTERKFKDIISNKTKLDVYYGTQVYSDEDDVIDCLKRLSE
jgi:hypothetical protein